MMDRFSLELKDPFSQVLSVVLVDHSCFENTELFFLLTAICFYGTDRAAKLSNFGSLSACFDIARGVNVMADSSDTTSKTVLSTSSSKGHAICPIGLSSGQGYWEFKLTKDVSGNEMTTFGFATCIEVTNSAYGTVIAFPRSFIFL